MKMATAFWGWRRVVLYKQTDVTEVRTAPIIRTTALIMEAIGLHSSNTSIYFYEIACCYS